MKRYAFPLTIILLLLAVIALAAPGDKRPAVTSAAIGLGATSSATMGSVTATTSVTAPAFNSSAADGHHYILPYNSTAFSGTPLTGMIQTTPTGPQWYTGSAWEAIGSGGGGTWGSITGTLSAQTDLQAALDAISAGGITMSAGIPANPGAAYLNDTTHVLTVASSTGYTQFTGSFTAWDTTPNAFSFTDETDIALSTAKTSNAITVAGINYPAAISVTGDTGYGYSKNSAACTATSGTVVAGDTVAACVTSSGSNSTATTATVTIGGVSDTYSVITAAGGASDGNPVWYYSNTSEAVGGLGADLNNYPTGAPVTISSGLTVTSIAFKVHDKGDASACKLALYSGTNLLASGSCTPANGAWCSTATTYVGSANATYRVMVACNNSSGSVTYYGEYATGLGIYTTVPYSTFPSDNPYMTTGVSNSMSVAVCTGGTCGAPR